VADDDVILYDGVCVFCSRWIRFVARATWSGGFASPQIQSGYGTGWRRRSASTRRSRHNAVRPCGVAHFKSDGALTVLSNLPGWGWVRALRSVPKPLRDAVYNLVARNRYRIFGSMRVFCAGCGI